ncbi:MFS transporter [Ruegeria marina]|uniref:Predicted arabinose efflux permease, MFS family n=1 Tax=Ruegeria marina TaxID=639004 RepID=A0A1G7AZ42_9RHOB|nr:MFS transporter [Ruegeria marina]SDE19847.1 Predicted arabinose efflux permease, MFS family [Ruegeria marina]
MTAAEMTDRARHAGIAGAIACTTIFALTVGLSFPLLSLVLEQQGTSEAAIGINAAMTPLGIMLASPFYPRLIERFGTWQVATGSLILSALLILSLGLTRSFGAFLVLRLALGMADVGIFIVSETWINQLARPESRGRVVGIYATALSVGFGAGPFTLALIGFQGFAPFAVGAACCALAMVVVLAVRAHAPDVRGETLVSPLGFLRRAPTLLAAICIYAFWEGAMLSLFPVFGLAAGLTVAVATSALSVAFLGNTVLQIPIGWLSDRSSRRQVMVLCALLTAAGAVLLPGLPDRLPLFLAVLFVFGATAGGIYTMAMAELGDRFSGSDLVAGNAAFAVAFGLGGLLGGPITGAAMQLAGNGGFAGALALVFAAMAALANLRRHRG